VVLGTWTGATRPHETPSAAAYFTGPMCHMRQLHPDSDNAFPTRIDSAHLDSATPERGGGKRRSRDDGRRGLLAVILLKQAVRALTFPSPPSLHGSCVGSLLLQPPSMASLFYSSVAVSVETVLVTPKRRLTVQDFDQSFHVFAEKCDESKDPPNQSTGALSGGM